VTTTFPSSRRLGILALLLAGLLTAGCSSTAGGSTAADGDGNADVATGGARFSTADEETAKLGSDAEPGEFPRTVTDARGQVEIPEKPERVVVLDTGELDDVLSLGVTPVGMTTTGGEHPVPTYLADQVEGVASVGTLNELNLEAIAELEPDLILGSQLRADALYDQLSEIAPTVFSIRPGFPWKENLLLVGDALGLEDEAVAALNAYQDEVEELAASIEGDPTISLVRFMPTRLRLYGDKSLIGVILTDAGLSRPAEQQIDELAVEISPETIDKAAGDVIFYTSYGAPEATGESTVVAGAGWRALEAVQKGNAHRVNDDVWFLGLGPTGAGLILDDLAEHLAGG
jgi:iron complex transport system substrate-binding protein